jgi:hypothetical protein
MTLNVRMPPMRSASAPPIGRTSEPQNTHAAVKYHGVEAVVGVEVDGQRGGESDEAAERHGVEKHEPPRVPHAQHGEVLRQFLRRWRVGAVLRGEYVDEEREGERQHRESEHGVPADGLREAGREQRGEHRARVARPGDAERDALILRRIPARRERQRDGERRAGDTEDEAERERAAVAVDLDEPRDAESCDHDELTDDAR